MISEWDTLGHVTTNRYDQFGNLTNVTVLEGRTNQLRHTSYAYDANGNRTNETVHTTNELLPSFL